MLTLITVALVTGFAAGLLIPLVAMLVNSIAKQVQEERQNRLWLARHRAIR